MSDWINDFLKNEEAAETFADNERRYTLKKGQNGLFLYDKVYEGWFWLGGDVVKAKKIVESLNFLDTNLFFNIRIEDDDSDSSESICDEECSVNRDWESSSSEWSHCDETSSSSSWGSCTSSSSSDCCDLSSSSWSDES
jgi:hypothetical protein